MSSRLDMERALRQGPDAVERYQRRKLEQKRAQRARRRAAGLTAAGKPVKRPDIQAGLILASGGLHPADCPCYDCLFGTRRDPTTGRIVHESYTRPVFRLATR